MFTLLYISQRKYVNKASVITFCIFIFFRYIPVLYTLYSLLGLLKICSLFNTMVPEDAGIELGTVAVFALTVGAANHLATPRPH